MSKRRILLIDDDHDVLTGTRVRLRAAGYDTVEALDGRQGVESAVQNKPDAILLDVRMPKVDGLETMAMLQEHDETKDIPIVMLSGSVHDQKRALDAGARYFLTKPYIGKKIIAAIGKAITKRSDLETQ